LVTRALPYGTFTRALGSLARATLPAQCWRQAL